jgi:hypothetical protein
MPFFGRGGCASPGRAPGAEAAACAGLPGDGVVTERGENYGGAWGLAARARPHGGGRKTEIS